MSRDLFCLLIKIGTLLESSKKFGYVQKSVLLKLPLVEATMASIDKYCRPVGFFLSQCLSEVVFNHQVHKQENPNRSIWRKTPGIIQNL